MLKMKSRTVVLIYFYKDVCKVSNSQGEKYFLWLIVRNFQTFESFALGLRYGRKAQMKELLASSTRKQRTKEEARVLEPSSGGISQMT